MLFHLFIHLLVILVCSLTRVQTPKLGVVRGEEEREREREKYWFFVPLIYVFIGWFLYVRRQDIEPSALTQGLVKWVLLTWHILWYLLTCFPIEHLWSIISPRLYSWRISILLFYYFSYIISNLPLISSSAFFILV